MPRHKDQLKKAYGELKAARILTTNNDILDIAAFHTHQCAEKSLKGYLIFQRSSIPKTHDLEELLQACFKFDQGFTEFLHDTLVLNPYATNTRYPNDQFSIDEEGMQKAMQHAERVFNYVINFMDVEKSAGNL